MKYEEYSIKKGGQEYRFSKLSRPRIDLIIDNTNELYNIKDITLIDDCSASEIAGILKEVGNILKDMHDKD